MFIGFEDRMKLFDLYDFRYIKEYLKNREELKNFKNKYRLNTRDIDSYTWHMKKFLEKVSYRSFNYKNLTLYLYKYGIQEEGSEKLFTVSIKNEQGIDFYIYFDYIKNGKVGYVCIIDEILNNKHINFYKRYRLDECIYEDGEFNIFKG